MSGFSNLKSSLLAEQVQEEIYQYILKTPIEVGAKLPNEFELGKMFGVGRSTVREAVKLLSSRGIVEVRQGSGTYVVRTTPLDLDPLGLTALEDKMSLALDLAEVRLVLEPGIAEMAALKASKEQLIPVIDTAVMMFVNVTHKKLIEETIMTHRNIAEAIATHDPIGAKTAMTMHLTFNRNAIKKLIEESKDIR